MEDKKLTELLQSMNGLIENLSLDAAASTVVLIGVMRALKSDPAATLALESAVAEFRAGSSTERDAEVTRRALLILDAIHE